MSGLLGHVVSLLTSQRENAATEALAYILKTRIALETFSAFLGAALRAEVPLARVETQRAVGPESRPDLIAYDGDGKTVAFLEAKLWAGLTEAQPVEYLRRLEEQGGKAVLFLVPTPRVESILAELSARAKAKGRDLTSWESRSGFRVATAGNGKALVVTSWTALLGVLRLELAKAGEKEALEDLEQLEGLIELFEVDGFIPLTSSELSDLDAPRRMVSLIDVVERGVQSAIGEKVLRQDGLRETPGRYSGGRYVAFGNVVCWMGVDLEAWFRLQVSPAWIFFYKSQTDVTAVAKALQQLAQESPSRLLSFKSADIAIPLVISPGAEEDTVVAQLREQIRKVGRALADAGLVKAS